MPSITGRDTGAGFGVEGTSALGGVGVKGESTSSDGVSGVARARSGVKGKSRRGNGVTGLSDESNGVVGNAKTGTGAGVMGNHETDGSGVLGASDGGTGVVGTSKKGHGVVGTVDTPASFGVIGENLGDGIGVVGTSDGGTGVAGASARGIGVTGRVADADAIGILGENEENGTGVTGISDGGIGVFGQTSGIRADELAAGVVGNNEGAGLGVLGICGRGIAGVLGQSDDGYGVRGQTSATVAAVHGENSRGPGVVGSSTGGGIGVVGESSSNDGVAGTAYVAGRSGVFGYNKAGGGNGVAGISESGAGVYAYSTKGPALFANSVLGNAVEASTMGPRGVTASCGTKGIAVEGGTISPESIGVYGVSYQFTGVSARSTYGLGLLARSYSSDALLATSDWGRAGNFIGTVNVTGAVHKSGGGFLIDHPLDPAGKLLAHSFVESPERKNIYDGTVQLDARGSATVRLPLWFDTLNQDFRYQLTAIGAPCPDLHVSAEIENRRFKIAGGKPGAKISWQVTGIRKDEWAQANPLVVEERKARKERGYYRHPDLFGAPAERSLEWARYPAVMRQQQELAEAAAEQGKQLANDAAKPRRKEAAGEMKRRNTPKKMA